MVQRMHGVLKPDRSKAIPARVLNVQSRKNLPGNRKIRLDRLVKADNPVICIKRRLGGIGDVIMTTPLLKAIKTLLPNCKLIYATDLDYADGCLGDIIRHNPYVDELIGNHQVNDEEYDYFVDITTTGLSKEKAGSVPPNRIDMFAEEVGVSIEADPVPTYIVQEFEKEQAAVEIKERFLYSGEDRKDVELIAIQARSNDARRTWPLNYVDELCDLLAKDPKKRVLLFDWGGQTDIWKAKERVFPILNMKFPLAAAIIEQSDVVVCPDSSVLHLAGALNKKTIAIFGPIPPQSRINHYANTEALALDLPCHPCWYSPKCIRSDANKLDCLIKITPELVYEAVEKKLKSSSVTSSIKYGHNMTTVGNQDPIILVKRTTSGMGDLAMATTGIEALKVKFPNKKIHVAVKKNLHALLENNPYIDEVIDVEQPINSRRYYMIVDISYPCARYEIARLNAKKRVEKNRVEVFAEALGTRELIPDLKPRYHPTEEELEFAKEFLKENNVNSDKPIVALVTHSAEIYRNWPEENYGKLVNLLIDNYNIVMLGLDRTEFYKNTIDARGLPLRKMASMIAVSDGLITVDTGPLHLGAALEVPTIALFGPIDYRARCKGYKNVTVVISDYDCIPCWRNGDTKCKRTNLVKSYSECMTKITPKQIANIAYKKFNKRAQ